MDTFKEILGLAGTSTGPPDVLRAIGASILVFFLPGFAWTLVFFRRIKVVERIALSFGLSIAVVTLSILALNLLFEVRITSVNSLLTIIAVTAVPAAIYGIIRFRGRRREANGG